MKHRPFPYLPGNVNFDLAPFRNFLGPGAPLRPDANLGNLRKKKGFQEAAHPKYAIVGREGGVLATMSNHLWANLCDLNGFSALPV